MSEIPLKPAISPGLDPNPPERLEISRSSGLRACLLSRGAAIQSLQVPTASGPKDVLLSFPRLEDYLSNPSYLGVTVGRYANRIEQAQLQLNGRVYPLTLTTGQLGHCLHGGQEGFSHRTWQCEVLQAGRKVRFTLESPAGDQGFPGTVWASVLYSLPDDRTLRIEFSAISDAPTVVSLANHAYFNLDGDGVSVHDHLLSVNADHFTPLKDNLIPSGEIRTVEGTALDLRNPVRVGDIRPEDDPQLALTGGLDHNFAVSQSNAAELPLVATLFSPASGIRMEMFATMPGLQVYTGQHLKPPFKPMAGLCLEAQHFPNAPNQPGFPSATLNPGESYRHICECRFSAD